MKNIDNITIGITTFKERLHIVTSLIDQIRLHTNVDILLMVNGNNNEIMPEDYRKQILQLCSSYNNIYPFVCPEFKSLSKLWNTQVIFSNTEYNLILNDDLTFNNPQIINEVIRYINNTQEEFFRINGSFSHFVITKSILHNLGYFDERLLAHGEEDGDMVQRYIRMYNKDVPSINIPGIRNENLPELSMKEAEFHKDTQNKPKVNREIAKLKYKNDPNGVCGMNSTPLAPTGVFEDYQQYPYEDFVRKNKHNISKFTKIILD